MSFTVLVPARLQSTRLPRKILADLGGVPMVVRVAQRAALSGADRVVVRPEHVETEAEMGEQLERMAEAVLR